MKAKGIEEVVTPFDSELAGTSKVLGLRIIPEAFAERRYDYNPARRQLTLVNRRKAYASIRDCDEAMEQALKIVKTGK